MNLYQFLSEPKAQTTCRICAIDFHAGMEMPMIRDSIKASDLDMEIRELPASSVDDSKQHQGTKGSREEIQGKILIIEDPTKDIIELLGIELDIDPLFFALHLHTVRRTGSRYQTPDEATLPSRILTQDFTNILYHRAVTTDEALPFKGRFLRSTSINRKLVFLRSTKIALVQHCASVIRVRNRKGSWLGKYFLFLGMILGLIKSSSGASGPSHQQRSCHRR